MELLIKPCKESFNFWAVIFFLSLTGISQKTVLVAHVNCDLLLLPQNKAFDASCSLFTLNMLFAYVLCLSLCFYLCYETLS